MRRLMFVVVSLFAAIPFCMAGIVLKEENDVVSGSDDYYTQGLELMFVGDIQTDQDGYAIRKSYGIRNLIYTPTDITIKENQEDDRPWAGLTAVSFEEWRRRREDIRRTEWLLGTVGEMSQSDHIQTEFHRTTHNRLPEGWDYQIPDEPIVNFGVDYYRPLLGLNAIHDEWDFDVTAAYGGNVGTAFVNMEVGWLARAGWNVPRDYFTGTIQPTANDDGGFFGYFFTGQKTRLVLHNVTLGGSLFQDGPSQTLEPFVFDLQGGCSVGVSRAFRTPLNIEISYSIVSRSREYEGQEKPVDFGSFTIAVSRSL